MNQQANQLPQASQAQLAQSAINPSLPPLIKWIDCIFVAFAVFDFYDSLVIYPAMQDPRLAKYLLFLRIVNAFLTVAAILFAIIFPIYWQRRERLGKIDSRLPHAWFTGILRYWLAVEISQYGFAKILGTQFAHTYYRDDSVWRNMSGMDLTWNYFAHSFTFALIIALLQIAGAVFLLFRRTTMAGIILLLPVMVNITLIDIFFDIPFGALMNAASFTLALFYLLFLHWGSIREFFIRTRVNLPAIRLGGIKGIIRIGLTGYGCLIIYFYTTLKAPASMAGKWKVEQLVRNTDTIRNLAWLTDKIAWKNIYLEEYGRAVLSPNPYIVDPERSMTGQYAYDGSRYRIRLTVGFSYPQKDTLYAIVSMGKDGRMQWELPYKRDTLHLVLSR